MGFHLLGSIPDCDQGGRDVPAAGPRGDPRKGQGSVVSRDMWVRSPVGEQVVFQPEGEEDACPTKGFPAKTCHELKVPHPQEAAGHFPANMQRPVATGPSDPRRSPLGKGAATDKNLLSLL